MLLILEYVKKTLPEIKAIVFSDYCKGVITKHLIGEILKLNAEIFIAVDPKIGHFDYYNGASLITPNITEASVGSGIEITDEKTLTDAGKTLLKKLGCKAVLITRGDEGMSLFEAGGGVTHIPTFAKEVYDVTGAGDTVIATFTLAHSAGATMKEAAILANHAAGIVVGEIGTATVRAEDLLQNLNKDRKGWF
jgi:D-beta-D-heptose 7-phosphate kinase/D-beta-D-heptose 1-phosphate adenosyltransferase